MELARQRSHPEVTPDHLLLALLGQEDGVVLPTLQRAGVAPLTLRNRIENGSAAAGWARPPSSRAWPAGSSRATSPRASRARRSSPWTWGRWWPAPNTGGSSRSG